MSKMISTHEMVGYLYNKALDKHDAAFIEHLHQMDLIGQITAMSDEDILRLDALYREYKERG